MPFAEILKPLQEKHAELTAVIKNLQIQIDLHKDNLRHLEATMRLFDGSTPILTKKEEKAKIFWHGELSRLIMDALRGKESGLSTTDITHAVMLTKNLDSEDKNFVKEIKEQVTRCLSRQKSIGLLSSKKSDGKDYIWDIKD
jgi:hypothetical protein